MNSKRTDITTMNTAKIRGKKGAIALALSLFGIIVVILVFYFTHDSDLADGKSGQREINSDLPESDLPTESGEALEFTINGKAVTVGEFRYALNEVKSMTVEACAQNVKSIGREFWQDNQAECAPEASYQARSEAQRIAARMEAASSSASAEFCAASTHPADFAACQAIRLLEKQHAAYAQAVQGGQMREGTWEEVLESLQQTNGSNERSRKEGSVVYGIDTYDLPVYLSKFILHLKDAYINTENAPGMNVTEAQIKAHYDANEWDFGAEIAGSEGELGTNPDVWSVISPSIKADLRTKIYYDLLAEQILSMDNQINRASLVKFVQLAYTK